MKSLFKICLCGMIFCVFLEPIWAITIGGTAPTVNTGVPAVDILINAELAAVFGDTSTPNTVLYEANEELQKFSNQPDLAKGFANANAYAAQAGTLQGYQDYDIFAVTTGVMVGAQLPSSDKDYYEDLDKKVENDGDLYGGVSVGLTIINFGLNAGFIYPGLYLNAKFGYFSNNSLVDNLSTKTTLAGLGANYSWIKTKSILAGFFKWRGLSFGTGILYNYNKTDFKIELDPIAETIDTSGFAGTVSSGSVVLDPSIKLGVESKSYVIPFDVTTSMRLLWFLNFNIGLGIDLVYGTTDINVKSDGNVYADLVPVSGTIDTIVLVIFM